MEDTLVDVLLVEPHLAFGTSLPSAVVAAAAAGIVQPCLDAVLALAKEGTLDLGFRGMQGEPSGDWH